MPRAHDIPLNVLVGTLTRNFLLNAVVAPWAASRSITLLHIYQVSALYCVSEIHTAKDLKKLAKAVKEVTA